MKMKFVGVDMNNVGSFNYSPTTHTHTRYCVQQILITHREYQIKVLTLVLINLQVFYVGLFLLV
jgi:hypothetical protein